MASRGFERMRSFAITRVDNVQAAHAQFEAQSTHKNPNPPAQTRRGRTPRHATAPSVTTFVFTVVFSQGEFSKRPASTFLPFCCSLLDRRVVCESCPAPSLASKHAHDNNARTCDVVLRLNVPCLFLVEAPPDKDLFRPCPLAFSNVRASP